MRIIKIDWSIIFFSVTAAVVGIMTLYGGGEYGETLAKKQIVWVVIGLFFMLAFTFINYQTLGAYAPFIYGLGIFLLIVTLLVAPEVKGARAWLRFKGLGFQPAEFMKLGLTITLARYLSVRDKRIANINELFIPFAIAFFPLILIAVQPDLGYAVLLIPLLFIMLFLAGANKHILMGLSIVGFFCFFVPMYLEYHKYIIIDDVVQALHMDNRKLSDAIRILGFETWHIVDHPEIYAKTPPEALGFAKATLLQADNMELLKKTVQFIYAQEKNYLRDILMSDKTIIITSVVLFVLYGLSTFVYYYYYKIDALKNIGIYCLIFGVALFLSFFMRKTLVFKPHQVIRIVSFANPDKFPKGAGYQLRHSIITIGSGEVFGKGYGNGDMTKGDISFLPEWYNDFIFSVIGEQFGLMGNMLVLLLLYGLILRGGVIAWRSKDQFGMLLASGITTMLFLHIFINCGISMGLLPVTGIPLVFVSYGGSSIVFSFISVGILLNIYMRRFTNI